jgi:hypothetical protein
MTNGRVGKDGRPIQPSRPSGQDQLAKDVKSTCKQFLALLSNWKGKTKDASVKHSAGDYYKTLNKNLPLLFKKGGRWEQSSAEPSWNNFKAVWDDGDGSWTDAHKALKSLNDGLQQSE